jgi:CzcA family heavy metal efflux pump
MTTGSEGIVGAIIRFSLRRRGVIIALAILFSVYGGYLLQLAGYDVFPEFAPPEVVIRAEAPGFAPKQTEALVTRPLESAINGVSGIESLRSVSMQGLSSITVRFSKGGEIYRARQEVAERLASLSGLPRGVTPFMTPLTSSTGTVLVLGLTSDKRTLMELRTIADHTLKRRLLAVAGVAKVAVFGRDEKQFQVQVDPDRMIKYNLSLEDVTAAAERATGIRGAGFIDTGNQRIFIETEGQSVTPEQIAATVLVRSEGANLTLGDVAKVVAAPAPPIGAAQIMGRPGVILSVSAQYGANTLKVTNGLDQAVAEFRPMLRARGIELYPGLFRPAGFIHTALRNIRTSLITGAILVAAVLLLFLFNLRSAAVSCAAIPLSLLAAVSVLEYMGFSLNTMTIGGLAIAIGEIVDDAVIDVENIVRRLRENHQAEKPRSALHVVFEASIEVRSAVVYATFAATLVFIPVLTLSGTSGSIFRPLGIAYICAILASLLVALTVTPALCLMLFGRRGPPAGESPVAGFLRDRYRSLLLRVEKRPALMICGVAVVLAAGLAMLPFLSSEFLPQLREGHYIVHMTSIPGTSLDESLRIGRRVSLELMKIPGLRYVSQQAGRAEQGEETRGSNAAELGLDFDPDVQTEPSQPEIQKVLAQFPGVVFSVNTFLEERISETVSGEAEPFAVSVFGNDLGMLDEKALEIAGLLRKIPGAEGVLATAPPDTPRIAADLKQDKLAQWGFDPVSVLDAIHTAYEGKNVGQVYDGDMAFDLSVLVDPARRKNVTDIGLLPLRSPEGIYIQLGQLADIRETQGRAVIMHDGGRRVRTVTCDVEGRSVGSFAAEAEKRIAGGVALPEGTYIEFKGSAEEEARSVRDLVLHSLLAGGGIIILLSIVLAGYRSLLLLLLNLPFALVGGVLMVAATGGVLSFGSMVGFVTVFGITLRNSIMMLSHYERLVSVEGMPWDADTALRGASERLAPILMTALVTGLGLLPLALSRNTAGREIEGPMALVILGGLATSTLLNLLVLPTLAVRFARFEKNADDRSESPPSG